MTRIPVIFVWAVSLIASNATAATLTLYGDISASPAPGVNYVNFDDLTLGISPQTAVGPNGSIQVEPEQPIAQQPWTWPGVVQGDAPGIWAPPLLSNNQGAFFGGQPDGQDATPFLTTGVYSIKLSFAAPQKYIGLLWSSVDSYNFLDLYSSSQGLLGTIFGTDLSAIRENLYLYTVYLNINSDVPIDYAVARSFGMAFEFDNVSYSPDNVSNPPGRFLGALTRGAVPDGGSMTAAFSLTICGLALLAWRRRPGR